MNIMPTLHHLHEKISRRDFLFLYTKLSVDIALQLLHLSYQRKLSRVSPENVHKTRIGPYIRIDIAFLYVVGVN